MNRDILNKFLNGRIVIHCRTKEEAGKLWEMCSEEIILTSEKEVLSNWEHFKEKTYFGFCGSRKYPPCTFYYGDIEVYKNSIDRSTAIIEYSALEIDDIPIKSESQKMLYLLHDSNAERVYMLKLTSGEKDLADWMIDNLEIDACLEKADAETIVEF